MSWRSLPIQPPRHAELLFQVFADRDERKSPPLTSSFFAFSDWGQVFQGERL